MDWLCFPAPSISENHLEMFEEFVEWVPLDFSEKKTKYFNEKTANPSFVEVKLDNEEDHFPKFFKSCTKGIPLLHLKPSKPSNTAILYFHANREDIFKSYSFCDNLRNNLQFDVYAVEYPGYSLYKQKVDRNKAKTDSVTVFDFLSPSFDEFIIIGRSIGSVMASFLASQRHISMLCLISPFYSVKEMVKEHLKLPLIPSTNMDIEAMLEMISCPVLLIHGKKDNIVSYKQSMKIFEKLQKGSVDLVIPSKMNHQSFNYYEDFTYYLKSFIKKCSLDSKDYNFNFSKYF